MSKYRCPTLGDCERANSAEIFERSAGEDLKCSGCGTLLEAIDSASGSSSRTGGGKSTKLAGIAVVAAVVLGAGGWFVLRKPASVPMAEASATAAMTPATPASTGAPNGLPPSEAELLRQKQEGQAGLAAGLASSAEASSTKAASNEMIKLGIAKMGQGKLDEAEKSFKSAGEIDPKQPLGYYNMAILRLRQGRTDEALKEFEASFMAGFSYFDKLDQDSDLNEIRKDKRFAELVARYRGK